MSDTNTGRDNVLNMLQMLDGEHSILIDENIGLLGSFSEEKEDKKGGSISDIDYTEAKIVADFETGQGLRIRRGDYFDVIDDMGTMLINKPTDLVGVIYDNKIITEHNPKGIVGYLFKIKDYNIIDEYNSFFEDGATEPSIILYINNILYTNDERLVEKNTQIIFDNSIHLENKAIGIKSITFKNSVYSGGKVCVNNELYKFKAVYLKL